MELGDIQSKTTWKVGASCGIVLEKDWLMFLGFTEEEIETGQVALVFKAEQSEKHKHPFIGFGKRR